MATDVFAEDAPWPNARGGSGNLGRPRCAVAPGQPQTPLWRFATNGPVLAPPVIDAQERVLVGSSDGTFYALNPARGRPSFTFPTTGRIVAGAALAPEGPIVAGTDGILLALDGHGQVRWRYDLAAERPTLTPSTSRAWRGSVALGPDGSIVVGNDDFHVYAFDADGSLSWAVPTGLPVRSLPACVGDRVVVASLDLCVYSLSASDGSVQWRRNVGNLVTGGVALDGEGSAVVGTAGGSVHALDLSTGEIRWSRNLGSPILGAVAQVGSGWVAGTLDGRLVLLGATGQVQWSTFLGAPLRSSPAFVPTPEGKVDLIYVGGGDGRLHAVTSLGQRRWTYDPWEQQTSVRGKGLGPVAVGRHGLATVSEGGEVIYVPWHAAQLDATGWTLDPRESADRSTRLHQALGGHRVVREATGTVTAKVGDIVSLQVLHQGDTLQRGVLEPGSIAATTDWPHDLRTTPPAHALHLIPTSLDPGTFEVDITLAVRVDDDRHTTAAPLTLEITGTDAGEAPRALRIRGLRCDDPPAAGLVDPVDLPALSLDVALLEEDSETGRGVAFGVIRSDDGDLLFAFATERAHGALVLVAEHCRLPIAGLRVSLQRLRLVAHAEAGVWRGGSMSVEAALRPNLVPDLSRAIQYPRALLERSGKPFVAARSLWTRAATWLSEPPTFDQVRRLGIGTPRTLTLAPKLVEAGTWGPWGLFDADRRFLGIGGFDVEAAPPPGAEGVVVDHVRADGTRRTVTAEIGGGAPRANQLHPGTFAILLVDERSGAPLPIDYTQRTEITRTGGIPSQITLEIPLATDLERPIEAWVVAGGTVVWRGPLTAGHRPAPEATDPPEPDPTTDATVPVEDPDLADPADTDPEST